jgi:hypothetical protein
MLVGTKRVRKHKHIDEDTDTLKRHKSEISQIGEDDSSQGPILTQSQS